MLYVLPLSHAVLRYAVVLFVVRAHFSPLPSCRMVPGCPPEVFLCCCCCCCCCSIYRFERHQESSSSNNDRAMILAGRRGVGKTTVFRAALVRVGRKKRWGHAIRIKKPRVYFSPSSTGALPTLWSSSLPSSAEVAETLSNV